MATNPPIVIGPFANVPAPGSGVRSDWAQQISTYVAPTPWVAPVFQNGWINFGGGAQTARYRKIGDRVFVEGRIKSGALNSAAFTLPAGFRSPLLISMVTISGSVVGMFYTDNTGAVIPSTGVATDFWINGSFSTT